MKIKTVFITAVLVIGAGAATSYYVKRSQETHAKKVEVIAVPSVNSAEYSMMDSGTISGTIVSKDTQVVTLDTSHELVDVYVQQGDRVKKGDKLLEYDMLGDELKAEMEELTKLGLELSLEGMKKDLEILKSGRMPESMGGGDGGDDSSDASSDEDDEDDGIDFSGGDDDDDDVDPGLDANGRSVNASVQWRGGGAVAAADTLAEEFTDWDSVGEASADSETSWTRESLTKALMEKGLLAQPVGDEEEQTTPQEGQFLDDSIVDLLLSGAVDDDVIDAILNGDIDPAALEVLLNGEESDSPEETALSLQELFDSISQQESGTTPDAIPAADGDEPADGLFAAEDEEAENPAVIQDGLFNENADSEAAAPALIATAEEGSVGLISEEEETDPAATDVPDGEDEAPSTWEELPDYSDYGESDYDPGAIVADPDNPDSPIYDIADNDIPLDVEDETDDTATYDIIEAINVFLSDVNDITIAVDGGWDVIPDQIEAINAAIELFCNSFAEAEQRETTDLYGEHVVVTSYVVSEEVREQVGDATATVLQEAYDRLSAYHFIHTMLTLNPENLSGADVDMEWLTENEGALKAAVLELAALPESMWIYNPDTGEYQFSNLYSSLNDLVFSGDSMLGFLKKAVSVSNNNSVMEERTDIPPVVTSKGKFYNLGQPTDTGDEEGDEGYGFTAEELAEAIKEQEKNIKETELQIREAELGIQEYKKILDGKIVYATMDGIVKSAGSSGSESSSAFITITGKEGLYVRGTVNELALDTVKVGDTITGTSYETGSSFTAEIVEISEYPDDSANSYYGGYGEENTNSSYYPFLAYIEDAEGLEVDTYVDLSLSENGFTDSGDPEISNGLCLEEFFIRKDNSGRSYCYVLGKDGLLEKRYLEIGANIWGYITIKSGLTPDDYIAFPYGKGVEEGAQTVKVESLSAVDGEEF